MSSFFRGRRGESLPTPDVSPDSPIAAGDVLGDYRLVRLIATGGMGQVWEAEQISLGRRVALKLLKSGLALSDAQLAMFEHEARAAAKLQHPNIVAVYASGQVGRLPFIAQELVADGFSLADAIEQARAEPELPANWYPRIATFFAEVADAIHAAHTAGVIHRDLKPHNILIGLDDRPRIADFGLAKVTGHETISATGDFAGTYRYMSPEQALAKRIGIDGRSDIFSLGVTLYEALTLRTAFDGDTTHQITEQILYEDPPEPRRVRSRVPTDLSVICMKMLEKRRRDRYSALSEARDDIRRHLAQLPILASPPSPLQAALRWSRRHPALTSTLLLAFASLTAISILLVLYQRSNEALTEQSVAAKNAKTAAEKRTDQLQHRTYVSNIQMAQAWIERGESDRARILLKASPPQSRDWEWGWLSQWAEERLIDLADHATPLIDAAMSRDGRLVVTASHDGLVRIRDGATGATLRSIMLPEPATTVTLSPDAQVLATTQADHTIRLWDTSSGEALSTLTRHSSSPYDITFGQPEGLICSTSRDRLCLWSMQTGNLIRELCNHERAAISPDGLRILTNRTYSAGFWLWNTRTGAFVSRMQAPDGRGAPDTSGAVFSADSSIILTFSEPAIYIWDASTGAPLYTIVTSLHTAPNISPNSLHILTQNEDTVNIWSTIDGRHEASLYDSFYAQDTISSRILTQTEGQDWVVWDIESSDVLGHVRGLQRGHWSHWLRRPYASFLGRNRLLWTDSKSDEASIWDIRTGNPVAQTRRPRSQHDPDGKVFLHAWSGHFGLWDALPRSKASRFLGHAAAVSSARLSNNTEYLASASFDRTARIWDPTDAHEHMVLEGHSDWIVDLAVRPDSEQIATASADGTTRLWDPYTALAVAELPSKGAWHSRLSYSPDSTRLATAAFDGTVDIWSTLSYEALPGIVWSGVTGDGVR